ncbi:MAG: plasmid stabilization protein [Mesorhizobium sp.]
MPAVTIRNIPAETHRALKIRAAHHGRSTEAEIRAILEMVVNPASRLRLGTALSQIGKEVGLTNADFEDLEAGQQKQPAEPVDFE